MSDDDMSLQEAMIKLINPQDYDGDLDAWYDALAVVLGEALRMVVNTEDQDGSLRVNADILQQMLNAAFTPQGDTHKFEPEKNRPKDGWCRICGLGFGDERHTPQGDTG